MKYMDYLLLSPSIVHDTFTLEESLSVISGLSKIEFLNFLSYITEKFHELYLTIQNGVPITDIEEHVSLLINMVRETCVFQGKHILVVINIEINEYNLNMTQRDEELEVSLF